MKKIVISFIVTVLLSIPLYGKAESLSPAALAEKIQQTYDQMGSLRFHFLQETSGEMTGRPQQGEGVATFLRNSSEKNRKMRWQYSRPDTQIIISDGNAFFMYFKKLKQLIISPAKQLATDITYAFFTGKGNLVNDFDILPATISPPAEEAQTIKLVPRTPQQQVAEIELQAGADGLITKIVITDHFGTITTLMLDEIEVNPLQGMPAKELEELFSFTPPPDTEIIEQ